MFFVLALDRLVITLLEPNEERGKKEGGGARDGDERRWQFGDDPSQQHRQKHLDHECGSEATKNVDRTKPHGEGANRVDALVTN